MALFKLTPDLRILNRLSGTDQQFNEENPGYKPSELQSDFDWPVIGDQINFLKHFESILKKYKLLRHKDNLLYLVLTVFDTLWAEISQIHENHRSKKIAKQLAQLLLLLEETKPGKLTTIQFANLTETAKTTEPILNDWIAKTLKDALKAKDFPITKFGPDVLKMLTVNGKALEQGNYNTESIKFYANLRLTNPKNSINKRVATLAMVILQYLENETELKAQEGNWSTDEQMVFIFEILQLLKQVDDEKFGANAKDYIRTLIKNHIS